MMSLYSLKLLRSTGGVRGDYKTHPQADPLVCFLGEVESALKKWLHPIIKAGGHIACCGSGDDENDGPLFSLWLITMAMGE